MKTNIKISIDLKKVFSVLLLLLFAAAWLLYFRFHDDIHYVNSSFVYEAILCVFTYFIAYRFMKGKTGELFRAILPFLAGIVIFALHLRLDIKIAPDFDTLWEGVLYSTTTLWIAFIITLALALFMAVKRGEIFKRSK